MKDSECVQFLQWVLPQLHVRWLGFRRVRGQVCKRLALRLEQLQLQDLVKYQHYLQDHPDEWQTLDALSRVTVSRFYRDKLMYATLAQDVMPSLVRQVQDAGEQVLQCWSAGCASGEEPYTMALLWEWILQAQFPLFAIQILATDADSHLLLRAQQACYPYSSVKNLPVPWRETAFTQSKDHYCLKPEYKKYVSFQQHDVRGLLPRRLFQLIMCRNLVFIYYDNERQLMIAERFRDAIAAGGVLVIGLHESLPEGLDGFVPINKRLGLYQKA